MQTSTRITINLSVAIVVLLAVAAMLAWWPDEKPQTVRLYPEAESTSQTLAPPSTVPAAVSTTSTTVKPRQIAYRATTTTREVPPPLTPEQEATIEAGLRGDLGQYCPDVCEDLPEHEDMSENLPIAEYETPLQ